MSTVKLASRRNGHSGVATPLAVARMEGMALSLFNSTGKRVRALRTDKDLNQTQLAAELQKRGIEVGRSFVSQVEGGFKQPPLDMLVALAKILGTTTDYLLLLTDDPMPARSTEAQIVIDVASRSERALLEDWVDLMQDVEPERRKSILDAVRLLVGPTKARIIGE